MAFRSAKGVLSRSERRHVAGVRFQCPLSAGPLLSLSSRSALAAEPNSLAKKAQDVLQTHCYRCHGAEGNVEGGMNYIVDLDRLVGRKKVIPGKPDDRPSISESSAGTMPPPDVKTAVDRRRQSSAQRVDRGRRSAARRRSEAGVRHAGTDQRMDPRRLRKDRSPIATVSALLHAHASLQRRRGRR